MSDLQKRRASEANKTHGRTRTAEYNAWCRMKSRCLDTKSKDYPAYGGRGITVYAGWLNDFAAFYHDVGPKPCLGTSLDRIDNARGYEPGNCRWATPTQQANNRRSSRVLSVNGVDLTIAQWAKETGISEDVIQQRVAKLGWSARRAVSTPTRSMS